MAERRASFPRRMSFPRRRESSPLASLRRLAWIPACAGMTAAVALAAMPVALAADTHRIDAAVEATVERYDLPGIAVGVIEDGQVAHVRTLGETVAGSGDPVTPESLFKIASNSKAMTATV